MPNSLIINCENATLARVLKTYRILFAFVVNVKEYDFIGPKREHGNAWMT